MDPRHALTAVSGWYLTWGSRFAMQSHGSQLSAAMKGVPANAGSRQDRVREHHKRHDCHYHEVQL